MTSELKLLSLPQQANATDDASHSDATGPDERLPAGERLLHKIIKEAHRLNAKERELALVLLQAIGAWNGMSDPA